jgi:hypothetical protein
MVRAFFSAAVGLALGVTASAADLTVVSKLTHDGKSQTATSYVSSDKVRMASSVDNEVIVDLAKAQYTIIDNAKKEYYVITKQDIEAAAAQMKAANEQMAAQRKQMEEQMKNLPPAMKEKLKGMGGGLAASVDVKKGAGKRTIAGYGCEEWVMTVGGVSKTESCLSTEVPFPVEAWQQYRDASEAFRSMGAGGQYLSDLQEKMKDMKGFALSTTTTVSIFGKTTTDTNEVTEIKKGALPAGAFDLPAGYKQKDSPFKAMKKK